MLLPWIMVELQDIVLINVTTIWNHAVPHRRRSLHIQYIEGSNLSWCDRHGSYIVRARCSFEPKRAWSNKNVGWRVVALANSVSIVSRDHLHCSIGRMGVVGVWNARMNSLHWRGYFRGQETTKDCTPFLPRKQLLHLFYKKLHVRVRYTGRVLLYY